MIFHLKSSLMRKPLVSAILLLRKGLHAKQSKKQAFDSKMTDFFQEFMGLTTWFFLGESIPTAYIP